MQQFHPITIVVIRFLNNIIGQSSNQRETLKVAFTILRSIVDKFKQCYNQLLPELQIFCTYSLREVDQISDQYQSRQIIKTLQRLFKISRFLSQKELLPFFKRWCQIFERTFQSQKKLNELMIEMTATSLLRYIFIYQKCTQEMAIQILQDTISKALVENKENCINLFGISATISILQVVGSSICSRQLQAIDKLMPLLVKSSLVTMEMAVWKWTETLSLKKQLSEPAILQNLDKLLKQSKDERQMIESRPILICISNIIKAYSPSINLHQQFSELLISIIRFSFYGQNLILLIDILTDNPQIIKGKNQQIFSQTSLHGTIMIPYQSERYASIFPIEVRCIPR